MAQYHQRQICCNTLTVHFYDRQLGIFTGFQTVVFQIKNNKHMLKYFGFPDYNQLIKEIL